MTYEVWGDPDGHEARLYERPDRRWVVDHGEWHETYPNRPQAEAKLREDGYERLGEGAADNT